MTDEENVDLGVLIAELRHAERSLCDMAADEIVRLVKMNAELTDKLVECWRRENDGRGSGEALL
jgi:hypothetical protein